MPKFLKTVFFFIVLRDMNNGYKSRKLINLMNQKMKNRKNYFFVKILFHKYFEFNLKIFKLMHYPLSSVKSYCVNFCGTLYQLSLYVLDIIFIICLRNSC